MKFGTPQSAHPPRLRGLRRFFSISLHKPLRDAQYHEALISYVVKAPSF